MEGLILKMNNQAEKIFGYNSKELINIKRVSIFSPGEIVIQNVLSWLKIANEKGSYETKTNFIKKDGTIFNAKIKITPNFADGILYFSQILFVKIFEPSSLDANLFGPKTLILNFSK